MHRTPCHAALKAYLESLPDPSLYAVAALMHAASDGACNVVTHWIRIRKVIVDRRARSSRSPCGGPATATRGRRRQLDLPCAIDELPNRQRLLETDLRVFQRPA